jgi:hypothetical protein
MSSSLAEIMAVVRRVVERFHHRLQPPCPENELEKLRKRTRNELNGILSESYLDLLRITNGLGEDGINVYASQLAPKKQFDGSDRDAFVAGFIDQNLEYRMDRQGYDKYHIFGNTELYVFGQDTSNGKYILLAHDDAEPSKVFDTLEELLESVLDRILRRERDDVSS